MLFVGRECCSLAAPLPLPSAAAAAVIPRRCWHCWRWRCCCLASACWLPSSPYFPVVLCCVAPFVGCAASCSTSDTHCSTACVCLCTACVCVYSGLWWCTHEQARAHQAKVFLNCSHPNHSSTHSSSKHQQQTLFLFSLAVWVCGLQVVWWQDRKG